MSGEQREREHLPVRTAGGEPVTDEQQIPDSAREVLHHLHGYHFIPEHEGERRALEPTADLVAAAAWLVIWMQLGSPSMLARRLGVTFASVGKVLHELQRWDVLGPKPDGSQPHPVRYPKDAAYEVHKQIVGVWRPEATR